MLAPLRKQADPNYIDDDSDSTYMYDKSSFFDHYWFANRTDPVCFYESPYIQEIARGLAQDGQFVLNRVNKYYVIAFAVDKQRFTIYSKDCDTETIKWDEDQEDMPCANPDPRNVNPVIALVAALNGVSGLDS